MKTVSMSGSPRANVGKKDAKALRCAQQVPCVIYGGKEQIHFSTDEVSFKDIIFTPEVCFVEVDINGTKYQTILQDIQYHKVSDQVIHADFFELCETRAITLPVPVVYEGSSPGVLKGGKLIRNLRKIKINALPKNMPESVVVNLNKLEIGDSVRISQLVGDNYAIMENKSTTICFVKTTRNVQAAAPAEAKK